MTAAAETLPHVELEPNPRIRWFRADGCVEEGADGIFSVYLAGALLGRFSRQQPVERDILLALLSSEKVARPGKLAWAFRVSRETVRGARARAQKGGLAALTQRRQRGAPSKRTAALRRRVYRLFERGQRPSAVHRAIQGRVSESTVRALYRQWQAQSKSTPTRAELDAAPAHAQLAPSLADGAGNDNCVVPVEAEPVGVMQLTSEPTECEAASAHSAAGKDNCAVPAAAEPVEAMQPALREPAESESSRPTETEQESVQTAAEAARSEMSLEEAAARSQGQMVQHAGTWIMLALLQTMGLYAAARDACGGVVPAVALRVALDAAAIALTLGERCVEGVRWLATSTAALLLRSAGAISASWTRRVLKCLAKQGSEALHLLMAYGYLKRARRQDGRIVLYVDNHLRPYTGQHTIRKGWRMQDKRARPGVTDYYVHDEDGRPLFRIAVPAHDSLTAHLKPIAGFVSTVFDDQVTPLLVFDRAGAFPAPMAALRDDDVEFTTYERAPYAQLPAAAFDRSVTLVRESRPKQPVVIRFTDERRKNLGQGRGRVGRIALRMPDGQQVNILTASTLPPEELIRLQLRRWGCQENQFKHGNARWAINQLDGRKVEAYPPDMVIPNPARSRLDRELRLLRAAEGVARSQLARLAPGDPKRARFKADLQHALDGQQELEALRPQTPTHVPLCETELSDTLVYHRGEYKTVIDTLRIALANAESTLATWLAPNLLKPREAKKTLARLLAAPGAVRFTTRTVNVTLSPAGTARDRKAFAALLDRFNATKPTLPGDPSQRRLVFKVQT